MGKAIQIIRGTTAENNNYIGALGSLSFDTDAKNLRLHDGVTMGGGTIMTIDQIREMMSPDYANRRSISSPFTAPHYGLITGNADSYEMNITVNGVSINLNGNDQGNEGPLCVPVSKGDVVTFDSVSNSAFVPYKGQVQSSGGVPEVE